MLFNSFTFAVFLPVFFVGYWFVFRNLRAQNLFVLAGSYLFYGWWDWRFLGLVILSSAMDYAIGLWLGAERRPGARRALIWASVAANIGLLGFFKYFNFFAESFADLLALVGLEASPITLQVILPVGISFYTFQTLSYTIDVYREKIPTTRDPVAFFSFVSFFPQLVAGPIERAANLLPQFERERVFDHREAAEGLRYALWGLFKKVVIADNCGFYADQIFGAVGAHSGSELLLGSLFFAIQIYGDFSGYSDIAIGVAKLLGVQLMRNFAFPYFARDIAEFWRRWHISLTTWFRDYVYIPLGGNRVAARRAILNVFVVFTVSGLWHGANWTFVAWGVLNAVYFLPLFIVGVHRDHAGPIAPGRWLPGLREGAAILITFLLTLLAWVFFRSPSLEAAIYYFRRMASLSLLSIPWRQMDGVAYVVVLLTWEWIVRHRQHGLDLPEVPRPARWAIYVLLISAVVWFGRFGQTFIYFQF